MVLAGSIVILFCIILFDATSFSFLLLVPTALIVFLISLFIGHFIAEPLRVLCRNMSIFVETRRMIPFGSKGELYEADCLNENFVRIVDMTLSQQEDLSIKGKRQTDFISDVAHELRTPLTAIHGNAEMLLDPDLPPELHDKFANIIINESERLGRLTNDLLTLQHIERAPLASELQRVDLHDLARNVADTLSPMLKNRDAHIELSGEAPDVLGDPDRLKQVLSNLIENASRFICPGGHIWIDLFGMKGNSIIVVKDDGKGFGNADLSLIFDRFYRADASRCRETGGSGLGLSIVKSIVEAHDGSVEAVDLPEGGACFIVAIPSIVEN